MLLNKQSVFDVFLKMFISMISIYIYCNWNLAGYIRVAQDFMMGLGEGSFRGWKHAVLWVDHIFFRHVDWWICFWGRTILLCSDFRFDNRKNWTLQMEFLDFGHKDCWIFIIWPTKMHKLYIIRVKHWITSIFVSNGAGVWSSAVWNRKVIFSTITGKGLSLFQENSMTSVSVSNDLLGIQRIHDFHQR